MVLNTENLKSETRGQGFKGGDQGTKQTSNPQTPSAFRVESANHLALASQENNQELQQLLASAIGAQQETARHTARVMDALESGEFLHNQICKELSAIRRKRESLVVQFDVLTADNLLPSADEVIRELNLLPGR